MKRREFLKQVGWLFATAVAAGAGAYLSNKSSNQSPQTVTTTLREEARTVTVDKVTTQHAIVERTVTKNVPEKDKEIDGKTYKYWENRDADTVIFFLGGGELDKESGSQFKIYSYEDTRSNYYNERKAFFDRLYITKVIV